MAMVPAQIMLTFPARLISPPEKELVQEWSRLSLKRVFISERRSDDPSIYLRVVIAAGRTDNPTHLLMAPQGFSEWIKTTLVSPDMPHQFGTLRAALRSICDVWAEAAQGSAFRQRIDGDQAAPREPALAHLARHSPTPPARR